jgi:aminoglycoside 6-adenylyltransferase
MKPFPLNYAKLEASIQDWAISNPELRLALVVGSRARSQPPPDEWSDLDLILFFEDPSPWTKQATWLETFGQIELIYQDTTRIGDVEWLLLYASGLKADFLVARFPPHIYSPSDRQEYLLHGPFSEVLPFGVRILVDKHGEFTDLPQKIDRAGAARLPNEKQYTTALHRFWMDCTRVAKFLRRGDLWRAKMLCDCQMKRQMLTQMEWCALANGTNSGQVWYDGRNLADWAGAPTLEALPATFGQYEVADLWRSLDASMRLFQRLARECSQQLGYPYPQDLEGRIWDQVHAIQAANPNHPNDS